MKTLTATHAHQGLYRLLSEVQESGEPVTITGRGTSAVLISEDDWRVLQETVYLLSVPGMRESIRDGMRLPVSTHAAGAPTWQRVSCGPSSGKRTWLSTGRRRERRGSLNWITSTAPRVVQ